MENLITKAVLATTEDNKSIKGYIENIYTNGVTVHTENGIIFVKHGKYEIIEDI